MFILNFVVEINFEEFAATGSLVDIEVEESPNLNARTQSISGTRYLGTWTALNSYNTCTSRKLHPRNTLPYQN